jgi:outer membrane protein
MNDGCKRMARVLLASVACFMLVGGANLASAETLSEALASAYSSNPTLRAERARQRGTDEQVPQALSGWRPTVTAQGTVAQTWSDTNVTPKSENTPANVTISLSQPIFRGFKTVNGTLQAEANVQAGRQNLLSVEQDILFQGIQAYMNVIRDRQIVALRQKNVNVLRQELNAANERFKVGEITRTDVAQSRARLAQAQAEVASATATLAASVANYENVIGHKPGSLKYPRIAKLPRSLDAAQAAALEINPNILAAAYVEEAANHNIKVVKGDLLPELDVTASATVTDDPGSGVERSNSEQIEGVLTVPLYEAGRVYSAVRESKQIASQRRLEVIEAGRAVRENVSTSWHLLESARQAVQADKVQVSANQLALDGVRQEYLVGSRTTLDVLDAEAELVTARIALVSVERDQVVSAYQILGSVGTLTARNLHLSVDYYDVEENYLAVRNKWFGTGANTVE